MFERMEIGSDRVCKRLWHLSGYDCMACLVVGFGGKAVGLLLAIVGDDV